MKVETDEIEIEEWKPELPFLKINSDQCEITEEISKSDTFRPFVKIKTEQQKCDICDKYYENLETHFANSHIKNEVQEGPSFYKYQNSTNFNVKKESNESETCDFSNDKMLECRENNLEQPSNKKGHKKCNPCNKYFNKKRDLMSHVKSRHKCYICEETFPMLSPKNLKIHIANSHKCLSCKKHFKDLKLHHCLISQFKISESSDDTIHKCKICNTYFNNSEKIIKHISTEHNEKGNSENNINNKELKATEIPLSKCIGRPRKQPKCNYCDKYFDKSQLKCHINNEHRCVPCRKFFPKTENLKSHIENDHKDHQCNICEQRFYSQNDLTKHKKLVCA